MCCSCSVAVHRRVSAVACQDLLPTLCSPNRDIWSFHHLLQRTCDLSFITPGDQKLLFVNFAQLLHERSMSDLSDGRTPHACTTRSPYVKKDHQTTHVGFWLRNHNFIISASCTWLWPELVAALFFMLLLWLPLLWLFSPQNKLGNAVLALAFSMPSFKILLLKSHSGQWQSCTLFLPRC